MKYLLITLSSLLSFFTMADEYIVKSKMNKVTVYTQGAQVHRSANYKISSGVHEVIIEGVSPRMDARSLQITGTGNVIILDSKYDIFYPKPEEIDVSDVLPLKIRQNISSLEDSIFNQGYEINILKSELDLINNSRNLIKNNGIMKGQGKVADSLELLKTSLEFYHNKLNELNKNYILVSKKYAIKNKELSGMQTRLRNLQQYGVNTGKKKPQPKQPVHRVIITLQSKSYSQGTLDISYLVANAGWQAMYDLRSSADEESINLNYKAHVYQNTGIDWDGVKLNISTNNPYQNKTKPELKEWYLTSYIPNVRKDIPASRQIQSVEPLLQEEVTMNSDNTERLSNSAPINMNKNFSYASNSANYTTVVDQKINVEFQIDLKYTIKSDNKKHMVLIKNQDIKADFAYYTVPKLDESVYLVAEISNLDDLKLVPAKANIFFDGSYVGETFISPGVMDDTLSLSLGKDPNLIVERKFLTKKYKEKILASHVSKSSNYILRVKNNKKDNVKIIIQDQIPVTRNEEITIEVDDIGKGKLTKSTGLVQWEVKVKSGDLTEVPLSYTVYHPKNMQIAVK